MFCKGVSSAAFSFCTERESERKMLQIVVIGGGAAGMMAAIQAAGEGRKVILLEKNEKLGKKLFITGKGRCNLTNDCDTEELFSRVVNNRKFLYSAFYGFTSQDTISFFEKAGLRVKTERGRRVFPASDKSSDVIRVLEGALASRGVRVYRFTEAVSIETEEGHVVSVTAVRNGKTLVYPAQRVLLATGGLSYPSTGSTGDGYRFASRLGHTVMKCHPSLVPLVTKEDCSKLMGVSLKNISFVLKKGKKELYAGFGELLFTHFGISGPLVLSASTCLRKHFLEHGGLPPLEAFLDLKPALSIEELDARILRDFSEAKNKQLKNALDHLLPKKMLPAVIAVSKISPERKVNELTRQERGQLVEAVKNFPLTVTAVRGYSEAVITSGGISVKEIQPSTMESRLVKGLYFAGEVMDVDAMTGGYNLQIAWATAVAAGRAMAEQSEEGGGQDAAEYCD